MNVGKRFEADFKKSVPSEHLIYRVPDSAQSFGGSQTLRFSNKNPFDFLLFDTTHRLLYAIELKTVGKKSISFENKIGDSGDIHIHQIHGLKEWKQFAYVVCGFIIEFRPIETCIFIDIDSFIRLTSLVGKKSFTICDLEKNNIPYFIVPQHKKRTKYNYDIADLLDHVSGNKIYYTMEDEYNDN